MNILDADVKQLNFRQLKLLSLQIRKFLIDNVSQTGGHLASNLGTTDLIVALHKVFDTAHDRVLFDVGHQAYAHKILTGRRDGFATLRQWGGLCGFPTPDESIHDPFIAGHASTAISTALGMARANHLQQQKRHCIAVVGDGALTGGLAYEALNDLGQSGEPVIVILNDNGMSISQNVGGVSKHLARLRTRPQYFDLKRSVHRITDALPGGRTVNRAIHAVKSSVRDTILPDGTLFESLGFLYLGPADGHSIEDMVHLFERAKQSKKPVLIHLITQKGKGYKAAEQDPSAFHGVGAFDVTNGNAVAAKSETFSDRFGAVLTHAAESNKDIVAVTAAMPDGVGLTTFAKRFPTRCFDVGIAEGHAVTMAAGMAKQGLKPVVAIYSSFLQRAYDHIIHDVALPQVPVVLCVDRAGLVGEDGATHQGLMDVGFLSQIPNMTLYAPASLAELELMLYAALRNTYGPVAIRYPRGGEGDYTANNAGGDFAVLKPGHDACLITYGALTTTALTVAQQLTDSGCGCGVIKLNKLSPLDFDNLLFHLPSRCAVIEDVVHNGSIGQQLAAYIAQTGAAVRPTLFNLGQSFVPHGSVTCQRVANGLDADSLLAALNDAWR